MRLGVKDQMYKTNVKRVELIQDKSLERYESSLDSLITFSKQVDEHNENVKVEEDRIQQSMAETRQRIREVRKQPKERDTLMGFLDKKFVPLSTARRFSPPPVTWHHYYSELTPKLNQRKASVVCCDKKSE